MLDNKILGSTAFLAILAIAFLGNGITGFVVDDEYTRQLCENNNDCTLPEVCCLFDGETAGICNQEDMCASISMLNSKQFEVASPSRDTYTSQFVVGILILVSLFVILYFSIYTKKSSE